VEVRMARSTPIPSTATAALPMQAHLVVEVLLLFD